MWAVAIKLFLINYHVFNMDILFYWDDKQNMVSFEVTKLMPFPLLMKYCKLLANSAPGEVQITHIFTLANGLNRFSVAHFSPLTAGATNCSKSVFGKIDVWRRNPCYFFFLQNGKIRN